MTPQPPQKKDLGFFQQAFKEGRLVFRLMKDGRVPFRAKLIPVAAFIYVLHPFDFMVGPIDDVAIVIFATNWFIDSAPAHVVAEHRQRLRAEMTGEVPPPPPPPARPTPPPPRPQPQPPQTPATAEVVDRSFTVAVHHSPNNDWSIFHFTPRLAGVIAENRHLRHKLTRLGDLKDNTLTVAREKEAEVISMLSESIEGLRVFFAK